MKSLLDKINGKEMKMNKGKKDARLHIIKAMKELAQDMMMRELMPKPEAEATIEVVEVSPLESVEEVETEEPSEELDLEEASEDELEEDSDEESEDDEDQLKALLAQTKKRE